MKDWTKCTNVEELQNRILELEMIFGSKIELRICGLERNETKIVNMLATRKQLTSEQLFFALYGGLSSVDTSIIRVYIYRIRKKLPKEIVIETLWGGSYQMSYESQQAWKKLVEAEMSRLEGPKWKSELMEISTSSFISKAKTEDPATD